VFSKKFIGLLPQHQVRKERSDCRFLPLDMIRERGRESYFSADCSEGEWSVENILPQNHLLQPNILFMIEY
jgi:hypothetical protein